MNVLSNLKDRAERLSYHLVYLLASGLFLVNRANEILSPDTIIYLRIARYVSLGNFSQSVTGYWSPLISWLMAPFFFVGVDGFVAFRCLTVLSGWLFTVAVRRLIGKFSIAPKIQIAATIIAGLIIADWATATLTPDILGASLIGCYFNLCLSENILKKRGIGFCAGIIGGLAYLAKHYNMPFFIIHYPTTILFHHYFTQKIGKEKDARRVLAVIVIGFLGFFLIAGPWVALISAKYNHLIFSRAPEVLSSQIGSFGGGGFTLHSGLSFPLGNAVSAYEDPPIHGANDDEKISYSKFKVLQLLMPRVYKNCFKILLHFYNFGGAIALVAYFLFPLISLRRRFCHPFLNAWSLATIPIFCIGYACLYAGDYRYFWPILIIIFLLAMKWLSLCLEEVDESGRDKYYLKASLLAVFFIAFLSRPMIHISNSFFLKEKHDQKNTYEDMALRLRPMVGPFASSSHYPSLWVAYFMNEKFCGVPRSFDAKGIALEMKHVGVKYFVLFDESRRCDSLLAEDLKRNADFVRVNEMPNGIISEWKSEITVYRLKGLRYEDFHGKVGGGADSVPVNKVTVS